MNQSIDIRKYYRPVQSAIPKQFEDVRYQEWEPAEGIREYIHCYWRLSSDKQLANDFRYRVVADGCTDVFFETKQPSRSFVMGFCNGFREFDLGRAFDYTGVRFYPSVFTQLFKIDALQITDLDQELKTLLPTLANFLAELKQENATRKSIDEYFKHLIDGISLNPDPRFYQAIYAILENAGEVQLSEMTATGISPRQLRRLFNYYIGASPKSFSKVIRFQKILNAKPLAAIPGKNKVFFSSGFYDQSHFIKEFRKFFGDSPAKSLRDQ